MFRRLLKREGLEGFPEGGRIMWAVNMARSCRSASCQSLLPRTSDKPGRVFLLAGNNVTLISTKLDANSSS